MRRCMWALRRIFGTRKVSALIFVLATTLWSQPCTIVSALMSSCLGSCPSSNYHQRDLRKQIWSGHSTTKNFMAASHHSYNKFPISEHGLQGPAWSGQDAASLPPPQTLTHFGWASPSQPSALSSTSLALGRQAFSSRVWELPVPSLSNNLTTGLGIAYSLFLYGVWVLLAFICIALFFFIATPLDYEVFGSRDFIWFTPGSQEPRRLSGMWDVLNKYLLNVLKDTKAIIFPIQKSGF